MKTLQQLTVTDPAELIFGKAPYPVTTRSGLKIGGGTVYPEVNFTLPAMTQVNDASIEEVRRNYREIIDAITDRAVALSVPGLVVEFETLPPMVENPQWGVEIAQILIEGLQKAEQSDGLKSALRFTPNDIREMERPPLMRQGHLYENMISSFEQAASAGVDMLSIESVGGKEVCDDALTFGDLPAVIFGLTVLGSRDMAFLWTKLREIADRHGAICAGDTACGIANTAMVLAEKQYIPRVFAAVVRAVSAVRSLMAYEHGAVGPGKDCGYENIIIKALTGYPMSMEGKTAACAHFSAVGNVSAAGCDLWSNESVQNVRLLGGPAPAAYAEQLIYDCRLMNEASADGPDDASRLQNWLVRSDASLDPQAYILAPENAITIANSMIGSDSAYQAGKQAALCTIEMLDNAVQAGNLWIDAREKPWLEMMRQSVQGLPATEDEFIGQMENHVDTSRFRADEYGLSW